MKALTKKQILKKQDKRQRPLTANDDAMESLENCVKDLIDTQEMYKKLLK